MKVSRFLSLLEIWKLIDKDPASKHILLTKKGARVSGMYIGSQKAASLE